MRRLRRFAALARRVRFMATTAGYVFGERRTVDIGGS